MIEFAVRVPGDTPAGASVYISGDADALGRWRADAVRLRRDGENAYRGRVELPPGRRAYYLVTLGDWRGVESHFGKERPPRELVPDGGDERVELEVTGWGRDQVQYHHGFGSEFLPHPRSLIVWLPPGYELDPGRRYPVFYMHDGQNLFDAHTAFANNPWRADETADGVIRRLDARPMIIVGVANTPDRLHEYGPRRRPPGGHDLARGYARFLVAEAKPFIDAEYRTLPGPADTAVGGSSMGGLISLHLCRWHPDVFGACAAVSPSLWWDREYFTRTAKTRPAWIRRSRIWLDMGGREGGSDAGRYGNLRRARQLAQAFRELGRDEGRDFVYHEFPDGEHNERHWGDRFGRVLAYLFPPG